MTDVVDELVEQAKQLLEQGIAKLDAERGPLAERLEAIETELNRLRTAFRAMNNEDEDASAVYRQPGVLKHRVSATTRRRYAPPPRRLGPKPEEIRPVIEAVMPGMEAAPGSQILLMVHKQLPDASAHSLNLALKALVVEGTVRHTGTGAGSRYKWIG